ncbi:MAG: PAS domain S-box protein, partial [Pseudomonadota bacterium]
ESEARYRDLVENSQDLICTHDLQGNLLFVNEAGTKISGYSNEALLKMNLRDMLAPVVRDRFTAYLAEIQAKGEAHGLMRIQTAGGEIRYLEFKNTLQTEAVTAPIARGMARDVTERVQLEKNLRASESNQRMILNSIDEIVYSVEQITPNSPEGITRFVSDRTEQILVYQPHEFLENPGLWFSLVHPDDIPVIQAQTAAIYASKQTGKREYRMRHKKTGEYRWMEDLVVPRLDEDGNVIGTFGVARDITGRKQAEEALIKQSEDIALINRLNQALNQGMNLSDYVHTLSEEFTRIFLSGPSQLYLLDEEKQFLVMQGPFLSKKDTRRIERLIGLSIPAINIPVGGISLYSQALREKKVLLCNDSQTIREMITEYAQIFLPRKLRSGVKKLIPNILEILGHKGILLMPLLAGDEPMGLLEVPSKVPFSDEDMRRIEIIAGQLTAAILRRRMEKALQESEERFRTMIETAHDIIWTLDSQGNVTYVNRRGEEISNYKISDIIGKEYSFKVLEEDLPKVQDAVIQTLHGKPQSFEARISSSDESILSLSVNQVPLYRSGDVIGAVCFGRDITESKRAEEALRESEERYRTLFDLSPSGILLIDINGNILETNDSICKSFGYSREELVGQNVRLFMPPGRKNLVDQDISTILSTGIFTHDVLNVRKDGTLFQMNLHEVAVTLPDGGRGILTIANDITERKQAEEALAASEAELRALFASMQDVVLVIDRLGVYLKIAPTNPDLLVKPPEELLGKTLRDIFPPEQAGTFISVVQQVLDTKQTMHIEYDLSIGDRTVWFETSISPMTEDSTLWVARDITARKQAEDATRQAEIRYRSLFEQAHDAVFILDFESRHLDANPRASELLGYTHDEILKLSVADTSAQLQESQQVMERLLAGEHIPLYERVFRKKNGDLVPVEINVELVRDADGQPLHIQSVVRDITERKESERALQRQLQELTLLHAVAIHASAAEEEDALIEQVTAIIGQTFYPDNFGFLMLNEAAGVLRPHHSYHSENVSLDIEFSIGQGIIGRTAADGKPRRIVDVTQATGYLAVFPGMHSELAMPLKVGERVIGVLNAESHKVNAFSEADERLLTILAGQVSTAIERLRLQRETLRHLRELQTLLEVSQAVTSAIELEPL